MPLLQEITRTQAEQIRISQINNQQMVGLGPNEAYASYFPTWEVTAPQYVVPTAYTLAQLGYRTNEVAYACIDLWMKTISEPPMKVWDVKKEDFVDNHPFEDWILQPCPDLSQTDFWTATEMYLKIAGFLGWEKEHSNNGSLLAVWPMMPQYCSFMRGEGQLLRAIRYQPYTGLPYLDVPRERVAIFSYVDPLYYGLKPFSPTAVLADIIGVDNNMTKLINSFLKNGTFADGLLKTEQVITEADATYARERWTQAHGGPENAGQIAVLGKGLEWVKSGSTFREMVFPEVDARNETRICMGYGVKPILISAKVGMDRSTMNNYKEARSAWYEENITSEWRFLEERATRDLLREFDDDPNHICKFDTSKIKALQEDRSATWTRATAAYKERVIPRNPALKEMGLDPLPDSDPAGEEYYTTTMNQTSTAVKDDLDVPNTKENNAPQTTVKEEKPTPEQMAEETKNFRTFAKRRIKENKRADIPEYEFKYLTDDEQRRLLSEFDVPDPDAALVLEGLKMLIDRLPVKQSAPAIYLTANIEPGQAPSVTVENKLPEQKSLEIPAPIVTVHVEPTPVTVTAPTVQNNIEVKTPKAKREIQRVRRDAGMNIEGTVTDIEYDE